MLNPFSPAISHLLNAALIICPRLVQSNVANETEKKRTLQILGGPTSCKLLQTKKKCVTKTTVGFTGYLSDKDLIFIYVLVHSVHFTPFPELVNRICVHRTSRKGAAVQ